MASLSSLRSKIYINLDTDPKNAILLCGSARSGTTWVADLINPDDHFRLMFEPFSRSHVPACSGFNIRQYLRPDNRDAYFLKVAGEIIGGGIRDKWIDRYNKKILCRERLIKDIRVNLMLKWIRSCFPTTKIVFLLRHPCAVALSRIRNGWETHLEEVLSQRELIDDHLSDHLDDIASAEDEFEKHMILWCIEHAVPLRQLASDEAFVVFYEDLCREPETVIPALFRWLGLDSERSALNRIGRPSVMTAKDSAVRTGEDLVGRWKKKIDKKQLDRAGSILERFSLDGVYSVDVLPRTKKPLTGSTGAGE